MPMFTARSVPAIALRLDLHPERTRAAGDEDVYLPGEWTRLGAMHGLTRSQY
jgi:hypothetical protein